MKFEVKIEKGIPLPPAKRGRNAPRGEVKSKYGLHKMQVDESVFIPGIDHGSISGVIHGFKYNFQKKFPSQPVPAFATRKWSEGVVQGIRVFRVG